MGPPEIGDPIDIQEDKLQDEQFEKQDVLEHENADMNTEGGDRHDDLCGPREQNSNIAQFDDQAEGSNNSENETRGVMLNQPDSRFPFVVEEDRAQRVLDESLFDVVSSNPIQS